MGKANKAHAKHAPTAEERVPVESASQKTARARSPAVEKASTAKTGKPLSQGRKYVPTPAEQAVMEKAASREVDPCPSFVQTEDGDIWLDHPDAIVGYKLLQNALGTSDPKFTSGLLAHLNAISKREGATALDHLNFLLSVVRSIEPKDALETMLALQMGAMHLSLTDVQVELSNSRVASHRADLLSAMNKTARTYAIQLEAFKRYRSKGEQKVLVQHVNVSEGGQAIVGDIHQQQKETANAARSPPALTHSGELPMEPIGDQPERVIAAKRKSGK
jgi:hypothetical protein